MGLSRSEIGDIVIKKILLVMLFSLLIVSCGDDAPKLRVFNTSDMKIENIVVEGVDFGDIEAKQHSDYKEFDRSYKTFIVTYTYNNEVITYDLEETDMMSGQKYCLGIDGNGYMFATEDFISCEDSKK
jgi:hypothetical protein